jgi:hypothetical protein
MPSSLCTQRALPFMDMQTGNEEMKGTNRECHLHISLYYKWNKIIIFNDIRFEVSSGED